MDNTDYSKYTVLIVDDIAVNVLLIKGMLAGLDFNLISANSGQEAIEKAIADKPDVILMDVLMPGMNGYDCTRALRANQLTADIPVVIVSALSSDADMKEGVAAGANDFLTKPLIKERVISCVRNQIKLSEDSKMRVGLLPFNDKQMRDGLTVIFSYLACNGNSMLAHSVTNLAAGMPMSLIDNTLTETIYGLAGETSDVAVTQGLLEWAVERISSKEIFMKRLPLLDCVADAIGKFGSLMRERNLKAVFNINDKMKILTDPEFFWAILVNLALCVCRTSSYSEITFTAMIEEGLLTLSIRGRYTAVSQDANIINQQLAVAIAERMNAAIVMDQESGSDFTYQLIIPASVREH